MSENGASLTQFCGEDVILEAVKNMNEMRIKFERLIGARESTLRNLKSLKKEIEESYDNSRKAKIGGSSAAVAGSAISLIGFALSPFTFGASSALGIGGGICAAAGGVTMAGADIGYYFVSKGKLDNAKIAYENDVKEMEELQKLGEKLDDLAELLAERFETSQWEAFEKLKQINIENFNCGGHGLREAYSTFKIADGLAGAGKTGVATFNTFRAGETGAHMGWLGGLIGQTGTRTLWSGLTTTGRTIGVVGAVFNTVLIPVDLGVLAKSIFDVYQYNKNGVSKSNRAEDVQKMINALEDHKEQLESSRDVLKRETEI